MIILYGFSLQNYFIMIMRKMQEKIIKYLFHGG